MAIREVLAEPLPITGAGLSLAWVDGLREEPGLPGHLLREPMDKWKDYRTIRNQDAWLQLLGKGRAFLFLLKSRIKTLKLW